MIKVIAASDVVITTALIPGRPAPKLITAEMVDAMAPGSVVIDLAAERGGNCELTKPDETVVHKGVTIIGPSNPAALVPYHASQMYSKNIITFLLHLLGKDGAKGPALPIDTADEITRETLLTHEGHVVHPRVRELLGAT
jgi:NAD(P) transhydrogenase subunit alpha